MEAVDLDDLIGGGVAVEESTTVEVRLAGDPVEKKPARKRAPKTETSPRRGREVLFFDLETVPDQSRIDKHGLPPMPPLAAFEDMMPVEQFVTQSLEAAKQAFAQRTPPGEWLEDLVAEESKRNGGPRKGLLEEIAKVSDRAAERQKLLSVTPEYNKIVAMGWAIGDTDVDSIVATNDEEEIELLQLWWQLAGSGNPILCGYNILGFDIPTILTRSCLLGVRPTRPVIDLKPWGTDCRDLMVIRWPKGGAMRLKSLAGSLGIEVPAGEVDGSCVGDLFRAGKFDEIHQYVQSDIHVARALHARWVGYFF